jgi:hypothetical protein
MDGPIILSSLTLERQEHLTIDIRGMVLEGVDWVMWLKVWTTGGLLLTVK